MDLAVALEMVKGLGIFLLFILYEISQAPLDVFTVFKLIFYLSYYN